LDGQLQLNTAVRGAKYPAVTAECGRDAAFGEANPTAKTGGKINATQDTRIHISLILLTHSKGAFIIFLEA